MEKFGERVLSVGEILHHDFGRQTENFQGIAKALLRNGFKFTEMVIRVVPAKFKRNQGSNAKFVTFRAISEPLVWHKYESGSYGAGQNHVIIHGRKIKTTDFLRWDEKVQDDILQNANVFKDQQKSLKEQNKADLAAFTELAKQHGWQFGHQDVKSGKKAVRLVITSTDKHKFQKDWDAAEEWREKFLNRRGYVKNKRSHIPEVINQESRAMMIVAKEKELYTFEEIEKILSKDWKVSMGWRNIIVQSKVALKLKAH